MVLSLININGCSVNNANKDNKNNKVSGTVYSEQPNITYEQYLKLIYTAKENLKFDNMTLTNSYFSKPTIIIVNNQMSFGKKQYLTLNNEQTDSTQSFLTYEDKKMAIN